MLRLYTQPNCPFCDLMKEMLDQTSHKYEVVNIREDPGALVWIRDRGHKTVPQLYLNDIHINQKSDTREYTSGELNDIISDVMDQQDWPWKDSGIEHGI